MDSNSDAVNPEAAPTFFPEAADFRGWLEQHHDTAKQLWVGYYKKPTGKPSVTWEETVDEALCYGWIDGIRKARDQESYVIRFTPRKPKSVWSQRNIDRVHALLSEDRMKPAGLAAFAHKDVHPDSGYRSSGVPAELTPGMVKRFQSRPDAWAFYQQQPAGYRRQTAKWVMDAKREETRQRRLRGLIDDSADRQRVRPFRKG